MSGLRKTFHLLKSTTVRSLIGVNSVDRSIPRILGQQYRLASYGGKVTYQPPHMDELPVPQGSWQKYDDEMNRKYGMQLIFGSAFFLVTVVYAFFSGTIFFNYTPPDLPGFERGRKCAPPPPKKC